MARLIVCDKCSTQENVQEMPACDLCPNCAFEIIKSLLANEQLRPSVLEMVGVPSAGRAQPPSSLNQEPPPGATTMTVEAQAKQRRAVLFIEHGTDVYTVKPTEDVVPKSKIRYGEPGHERLIEIIEPVPGNPGTWFAKMCGSKP